MTGIAYPPWMIIRGNLILVLMEDTLRGYSWGIFSLLPLVLILVLMEDALRATLIYCTTPEAYTS